MRRAASLVQTAGWKQSGAHAEGRADKHRESDWPAAGLRLTAAAGAKSVETMAVPRRADGTAWGWGWRTPAVVALALAAVVLALPLWLPKTVRLAWSWLARRFDG